MLMQFFFFWKSKMTVTTTRRSGEEKTTPGLIRLEPSDNPSGMLRPDAPASSCNAGQADEGARLTRAHRCPPLEDMTGYTDQVGLEVHASGGRMVPRPPLGVLDAASLLDNEWPPLSLRWRLEGAPGRESREFCWSRHASGAPRPGPRGRAPEAQRGEACPWRASGGARGSRPRASAAAEAASGGGRARPAAAAQGAPPAAKARPARGAERSRSPPRLPWKPRDLPYPWEEHWSDDHGLPYYWNCENGESTWEWPWDHEG
ncbi:unnamed protein product [Prorocentrum cordatum]|uniref:WW domain-containing protein n=1 Tax=Prorocentrum cordatum TaxID=2364126 RepID=A0ABN9U0M4_9DINO|nr:unnamed protein product [Polarella glacialis]